MKFLGEWVQFNIASFRNDVYLEDLSTTTETAALVVDSDGKISKNVTSGVNMTNGADNRVVTAVGTNGLNAEAYLTFENDSNVSTLKLVSNENELDYFSITTTTNGFTTFETVDADAQGAGMEFKADQNMHFKGIVGHYYYYPTHTNTSDWFHIDVGNNGDTVLRTVDTAAANAHLELEADGNITLDAAGNITLESTDLNYLYGRTVHIENNISSHGATVFIQDQNNSADEKMQMIFQKDKGAAGADDDAIYSIYGKADNSAQENTTFTKIESVVSRATDTDESGGLSLKVATSDGSTSTLKSGVQITGHSSDNDVDVDLGSGVTSLTTIAGDLVVTSDLTVSGTTTTINTANLNVEDKNITLNYHVSGDTSSTADGAGITIQDAVDASNDASLTWTASDDTFEFSHAVEINNGASGGTAALTIDNDDTNQIALDIDASNTNGNIIDINAQALTSGDAISIDSNSLTSGNLIYGDWDLAGIGNLSHTRGLHFDIDKSGNVATGEQSNIYGTDIHFNDNGTNVGTSRFMGHRVICTDTDAEGSNERYGFYAKIQGGDPLLNFGLYAQVQDGGYDIKTVSTGDTADFATWATTTNGATKITTVDDSHALAHFEIEADGNITLDASYTINLESDTLNCDAGTVVFSSTASGRPDFQLKNTNNDSSASKLQFVKDRGAASVDNDDIGSIHFSGEDDGQNYTDYAQIVAQISESAHTDEAGKLTINVAESDGTTSTLSPGLIIEGEHATDGQVDVTIANGAASTTTIAGDLVVNGDSLIFESSDDSEPVVQIKNTNSNTSSAELHFVKDKGAAGADGDELGIIKFFGDDAGQNQTNFGHIKGAIATAADGSEGGSIKLAVASHDGEIQNGLQIIDGNLEDEIDVIIGSGAASLTSIAGDLRVGTTTTSDNWISIDAYSGDDTSGGGITFHENDEGTYPNAPRYGAKIVYNEADDHFSLGTIQDNVYMKQLYIRRAFDYIHFADLTIIEGSTPSLQLKDTRTTIATDDNVGELRWTNKDDTGTTATIKAVATEDHADDANGGTKLEFLVTPNTTSTQATALTIDQDLSLTSVGQMYAATRLTVKNTAASGSTNGGIVRLICDDGAAMGNDHRLGTVDFWGAEDASGTYKAGASISAFADAAWSASENGTRLEFQTTDANADGPDVALTLDSNQDATFAGNATINGGNLLVTSGTSGDCVLTISADTDNSEELDSPKLWFKADGDIIQGAIQHKNNTFDFISNVSSNGGFRFLTGTTNNTGTTDPENGATERMSIGSDGTVTVASKLRLGTAEDTAVERSAAGKVTIEGAQIITAGAVSVASGSQAPVGMQVARRTLTTGEMNALHTTPIEIIPAQGANTIIQIVPGSLAFADRAATNTAGSTFAIGFDGFTENYSLLYSRRFMYNITTDLLFQLNGYRGWQADDAADVINKKIEAVFFGSCTPDCFTSVDIFVNYYVLDVS